jgi:hypothetical protein
MRRLGTDDTRISNPVSAGGDLRDLSGFILRNMRLPGFKKTRVVFCRVAPRSPAWQLDLRALPIAAVTEMRGGAWLLDCRLAFLRPLHVGRVTTMRQKTRKFGESVGPVLKRDGTTTIEETRPL